MDWCDICDRAFQSEDHLRQHMQVHKPRNLECWFCYSTFKSPADIFLHVDAGTCSGQDSETVRRNIVKCRGPWRNRGDLATSFPFQCPMCDRIFHRVASFLQHVQGSRCGEGYRTGRCSAVGMLRQLRRNLKIGRQVIEGDIVI